METNFPRKLQRKYQGGQICAQRMKERREGIQTEMNRCKQKETWGEGIKYGNGIMFQRLEEIITSHYFGKIYFFLMLPTKVIFENFSFFESENYLLSLLVNLVTGQWTHLLNLKKVGP